MQHADQAGTETERMSDEQPLNHLRALDALRRDVVLIACDWNGTLVADAERGSQDDPEDVLADYPHVCRSVLNFGVPSFSGRRAKDFDPAVLGRELREVVGAFEPRLKRDTIRVTVDTGSREGLKVKIEGVLMLSPVPERLRLSTTIDLDNGRAATRIEEG